MGSFGLTEPEVGSGTSRGLTTTARRDGNSWALNGQKKWIGNATFADLNMIIRGGFNVYPREIEEVLMTHPAVSLAAVIGVPHDRHGEEVKAFVILKEGVTVTDVELVAWSKQNMADYKYPRFIAFREALPMNATGKVLKSELR